MNIQKYIHQASQIVRKHLQDDSANIFLFGSRAAGSESIKSDIDIGIQCEKAIPLSTLGLIKEEIENSDIPYFVDVVDFSRVSQSFRDIAANNTIQL